MEQSSFYVVCGVLASVFMILGYLPQAIQTIRTRETDGIALPTFLMMGIGSICFMLQGVLHKPNIIWSMFLTNLVTTICSIIVFGIKFYNDFIKKKKKWFCIEEDIATLQDKIKKHLSFLLFYPNQQINLY